MERSIEIGKIAKVIRSKNAGPYKITIDVIFADFETFDRVRKSKILHRKTISELYKLSEDAEISITEFTPAKAIKITFPRRIPSGSIGDSDVYGAQQHMPLYNLRVPA